MPHETQVSPSMESLKERLERIIAEMEENPSDASVYFADIDDVPEEFFESLDSDIYSRLLFHFGVITVTGSPSKPHEEAQIVLSDSFLSALSSVFGDCSASGSVINIVNCYACGKITAKSADVLVTRNRDAMPLLAGEVGFTNESLEDLFLETIHFLTEYTTPWYSIGMKIRPSGPFLAYLFVLGRLDSNAPESENLYDDTISTFKKKILQRGKKTCKEKMKIPKYLLEKFPQSREEINEILNLCGVQIVFLREITEENILEDIFISLPHYNCNVMIPRERIAEIFRRYNQFRNS